ATAERDRRVDRPHARRAARSREIGFDGRRQWRARESAHVFPTTERVARSKGDKNRANKPADLFPRLAAAAHRVSVNCLRHWAGPWRHQDFARPEYPPQ